MKQSVYSLAITVLFCCPATAWPQSPELVLPIIQNSSISNLEFSPNGRLTASSSLLDTRIWETTSGRLIRTFPTPDDVITALSPDGKLLLSGTRIAFWDEGDAYSANIQLWDTYTGKLREPIYQFGPETSTTNLEFNKNGQYFLASTKDSTLIWNVSTLTLQHRFLGEGFWMPDGEQVLICGDQFKILHYRS